MVPPRQNPQWQYERVEKYDDVWKGQGMMKAREEIVHVTWKYPSPKIIHLHPCKIKDSKFTPFLSLTPNSKNPICFSSTTRRLDDSTPYNTDASPSPHSGQCLNSRPSTAAETISPSYAATQNQPHSSVRFISAESTEPHRCDAVSSDLAATLGEVMFRAASLRYSQRLLGCVVGFLRARLEFDADA
ncbi:hypothetical protein K402DRAFT_273325 [Aulographum hederae CBS 113979]|uniref:Uncharacterized protein n=1 Tax=Aulographum hederae CBS 113979 TaxID=1176131 RepID=A0A6G1H945_9PEZI|nr:hypothetical protein K402DRAFT_273325 [Aulographum hederae CBS 113979]